MTYFGLSDFDFRMAEIIIEDTFGDVVSVQDKKKTLLKFGDRDDVGTSRATVARLGSGELHETYVSSNTITHVASDSGSDTGSATIEYHTVDGSGNFTFGVQTVTLAGTTKTALTTPCARVSRMYNPTATEWVGNIYVAEDVTFTGGVPQTASAVHLVVSAGEQQSFKAATTISNSDYYIVTGGTVSVLKKTSATVDFRLEVRQKGGVFRPVAIVGASTTGVNSVYVPLYPPVIVPANADVRITAVSSAASTEVAGWMQGYLASVVT